MAEVREEPGIGDISPMAPEGVEKEPMALIDTTGSMTWAAEDGGTTTRAEVLGEAMGALVEKLTALDSQRSKEQAAAGDEDEGGLMAVTFARGTDYSADPDSNPRNGKIGDLSPENWRDKWAKIQWGGGTEIMPGWNALNEVFLDEFGDTPALDRPKMMALIITDGEASDTDVFAEEMKKVGKRAYVVLAIMGYGDEHDRAFALYQKVAEANDHIRLISFASITDPSKLADALASLAG